MCLNERKMGLIRFDEKTELDVFLLDNNEECPKSEDIKNIFVDWELDPFVGSATFWFDGEEVSEDDLGAYIMGWIKEGTEVNYFVHKSVFECLKIFYSSMTLDGKIAAVRHLFPTPVILLFHAALVTGKTFEQIAKKPKPKPEPKQELKGIKRDMFVVGLMATIQEYICDVLGDSVDGAITINISLGDK